MGKTLNIDLTDVLKNADPQELAKAVASTYGMQGIRTIKDMWDNAAADLHIVPSAHEVPSGPGMRSSGHGAELAVEDYSNPAAQMGLMEKYKEFEKLITEFKGVAAKSQEIAKSQGDKLEEAMGNILAIQKRMVDADELRKAKKAEKKAKKSDKMKEKAKMCAAKAKEDIADLTAAISKAAEFAAIDVGFVSEARKSLIDAGAYHETYVEYEAKGEVLPAYEAARKAKKALKKAWNALVKAERSALTAHGLHGHGNQKDEAESDAPRSQDDEHGVSKSLLVGDAKDIALGGLQILSEAKANGGTLPDGLAPAAEPAAKAEDKPFPPKKDDDKKEAKEEKDEKEPEKKAKADEPATKDDQFKKAMVDRVAAIESRLSATPSKPSIVPVVLKSGIQSDAIMNNLTKKLMEAQKERTMSDEGIAKARNLLDRFRAAAKGRIEVGIVQQQLEQADDEVKNFFYVADKEMSATA